MIRFSLSKSYHIIGDKNNQSFLCEGSTFVSWSGLDINKQ